MPQRGLFIAGTDTGVGKTAAAAAVLRYLRVRRGLDAVPMKPVQTGCRGGGRTGWRAPDLQVCLDSVSLAPSAAERRLMTPYGYRPACSPHLAARMAGRWPQLAHIRRCADRLLAAHAFVVVEGAGGVMTPLNGRHTMADLIRALGFPVLLVGRNALGGINQALLSLAALRQAGAAVIGVLLNEPCAGVSGERYIREDNSAAIAAYGRVPVLGRIPYGPVSPHAGRCGGAGADGVWGDLARLVPALARRLDRMAAEAGG